MIEVIQAPELEVGSSCLHDAIRVTYVIDGVTTVVDVPKVGVFGGKNVYQIYTPDDNNISYDGTNWTIVFEDFVYTCVSDAEIPSGLTWVYQGGTELDSITTESVQIETGCILVNYEGEQYQLIEVVENDYRYYDEDTSNIFIQLIEGVWTLLGSLSATTPDASPYSTNWDLEGLTTEECECGFTSKWQAVHHPIKWQLQRKDALVDEKDTVSGGFVRLQLSDTPPTGVAIGTSVIYYKPDGGTISGIITLIAVNNLTLNVIESGTILGGFVIFPNLYSNYFIETAVMHNGTTEIGTLRTIPSSDGLAVVDVHRFLKTQAVFENDYNYTSLTAIDNGLSGKYKLKFRENYNFTQQAYSSLTAFYYWSNSAKQIRDIYGSNMAEYVGNLEQPCKFLSVFERPTHFLGFPFSLSFITSGDFVKQIRKNENLSTYTFLTTTTLNNGAVNRLLVSDTATSVSIEYGIPDFFGAFIKQGDLTETKQIKINTECLQNAVCLSWLNTLGGREHWVFKYNQIYSIDTSIGATFEPYIEDLATERGNLFDLERFETNKITLGATVDIEDIKGLKTILSSICVEMETAQGWVNVRPETGSFKIYESKGTTADIEFTIQLPYTNIQSR